MNKHICSFELLHAPSNDVHWRSAATCTLQVHSPAVLIAHCSTTNKSSDNHTQCALCHSLSTEQRSNMNSPLPCCITNIKMHSKFCMPVMQPLRLLSAHGLSTLAWTVLASSLAAIKSLLSAQITTELRVSSTAIKSRMTRSTPGEMSRTCSCMVTVLVCLQSLIGLCQILAQACDGPLTCDGRGQICQMVFLA